jgi:hypothetical protein
MKISPLPKRLLSEYALVSSARANHRPGILVPRRETALT